MSSLNDSNDTQEELSAEKKKKFHLVGLLKGLAKFFFGNVWIVLISVILAFVAWFAISVNEFPEIDKSLIGIPIEAEPTDFMKSNNLQIIGDYTRHHGYPHKRQALRYIRPESRGLHSRARPHERPPRRHLRPFSNDSL